MKTTRRNFITKSILATAGFTTVLHSIAEANPQQQITSIKNVTKPGEFSINIFSKNLHWLNYADMAAAAAEMGFDGVDLTVRPEGHVLPENVIQDLPKAIAAIRKAGLNVHMITTAIDNADDPLTDTILKTASALGVSYYRMGWISYDEKLDIKENLEIIKGKLIKLAALNKKYSIQGQYQNHSGTSFGSPVWDLANILTEINSPWLGSQYDILHATVEGANSWPLGLKLLKSHIGSIDIKDFHWEKKDDKWRSQTNPLGEGMVDFNKYFKLLKDYNIQVPFCIHYEYPLGGAESGAKVITMKREEVIEVMKKDVMTLKILAAEAGLR